MLKLTAADGHEFDAFEAGNINARRALTFKAAVGWYGGQIAAVRSELPNCPVQLHFGEKDTGIALTDVDAIKIAHPDIPVFVYPGAAYGFGCEARASYRTHDAELAERRSLAFFAEHLR